MLLAFYESFRHLLPNGEKLTLLLAKISNKGKNVKQSHYRHGRSRRFQEPEALRFQDNRHMKVLSLSALSTGRL
jgi:hypothetical protein